MHLLKLYILIPVLAVIISMNFLNPITISDVNGSVNITEHETGQIINFAISHGHCNLVFTGITEYVRVHNTKGDPSALKLDFSINTSTLNTFDNGGPLTQSLKTKEMFNGDGKNHITFKTIDVFMLGENWIQFRGTMTIKGKEKTLRLRATPNYNGDQLNGLILDGVVDLEDYGIVSENEVESEDGHVMFLNMVVAIEAEAKCQPN